MFCTFSESFSINDFNSTSRITCSLDKGLLYFIVNLLFVIALDTNNTIFLMKFFLKMANIFAEVP